MAEPAGWRVKKSDSWLYYYYRSETWAKLEAKNGETVEALYSESDYLELEQEIKRLRSKYHADVLELRHELRELIKERDAAIAAGIASPYPRPRNI